MDLIQMSKTKTQKLQTEKVIPGVKMGNFAI